MQVKDIVSFLVWAAGVVAVIVEFNNKVPFHPLSCAVRWMGEILNKETLEKLDELAMQAAENKQAAESLRRDMESRFDAYEKASNEQKAVDLRNLIINFAENLRLGRKYTGKQFERVFGIMNEYYEHCKKYDIKNHYIEEEHEYIREQFRIQTKGKNHE